MGYDENCDWREREKEVKHFRRGVKRPKFLNGLQGTSDVECHTGFVET